MVGDLLIPPAQRLPGRFFKDSLLVVASGKGVDGIQAGEERNGGEHHHPGRDHSQPEPESQPPGSRFPLPPGYLPATTLAHPHLPLGAAGSGLAGYGGRVRGVPWWGVLSAAGAPVLLMGGWTVAAALQPGSFSQVADTISALAAYGAADRWVMTAALSGVGACYVVTALALWPAAAAGRLFPGGWRCGDGAGRGEPGDCLAGRLAAAHALGSSWIHCPGRLAAAGRRRGLSAAALLRPAACAGASAVLFALLVWFGVELSTGGGRIGLAERMLAGAQALWPLAVTLACYRSWSRPGHHPAAR